MMSGFLSAREYAALMGAFRELVVLSGGPVAAGRIARVSQQQISRYISTDDDFVDYIAPLDVIADLEAECGQPIVTRVLAEQSGHVLVPLPKAPPNEPGIELVARVTDLLREVSGVSGGVCDALGDGQVSKKESRGLHREVREAHTALALLDLQIERAAGRPLSDVDGKGPAGGRER